MVSMPTSDQKTHQNGIAIRSAKPQDSAEAAKLIYMTGEDIFKYIFYPNKKKSLVILERLFAMDANDFTHNNAYIADMDGRIAGLVHVVDRNDIMKNYWATGKKLIKAMGLFQTLIRMPRCIQLERLFPQPDKNSMYINHLATFEEFRGQGIAKKLIGFCEQLVASRHLVKLTLDVEVNNTDALKVYENLGFRSVQKIESDRFKARFGFNGAYRMVKP